MQFDVLTCAESKLTPTSATVISSEIGVAKDTVVLGTLKTPYTDPGDRRTFASIHSNPPGILTDYPSIMERSFGKGKVIWLAIPFEYYAGRQHRDLEVHHGEWSFTSACDAQFFVLQL